MLRIIEKKIFVGDAFFVGDEIEVLANFKPEKAHLTLENETFEIDFEEFNGSFVYRFVAEKPGIYELRVDEVEKKIFVDSCELDAEIVDKKVVGRVSTIFSSISSLEFILPSNESGFVEVKNNSFEINLPKDTTEITLVCKKSVLKLEVGAFERVVSDFKSIELKKMVFNFSIDKGKFEALDFDGENLSFVISGLKLGEEVSLGISLPFEIPEGLHFYYWKEANGELVAVDYTIKDKRAVILKLKDGEDEDRVENGVIVDPLRFYVPKIDVEKLIDGKKGSLRVEKEERFEIKFETSGEIRYLAFVDPENLPSKPVDFPYGLVKFEVEVGRGEEAEIRITYPSLEGFVGDDGKARFYKFNPKTLHWESFDVDVDNDTIILRFKDGGFGDEDGIENGIISDDGGVGWAGYPGLNGASICRDGKTNEIHTYWVYVPSGNTFNVSVYDGDALIVRVYYPSGTLYGTYTASANNGWDNFTIYTNSIFGWWRVEIFEDSWPSSNGNYYGLRVNGTDEINIRVNYSWNVGGQNFYGTPDSVIVGEETSLNLSQNYYVVADIFNLSIYDPDGPPTRLRVTVTSPSGAVSTWNTTGNNVWRSNPYTGEFGIWQITVTQISDFNDYTTAGNHYRLAVNLSEGLYFKPPQLLNITGRVLHDLYPLGRNEGEDVRIQGVEVLLVEDRNGNGVPENNDRVWQRNITDANGNFSLKAVKDTTRTYFVVVNSKSINATNASLSYNAGFNINYIWAEQTYQTNENNYGEVIWFFGGRYADRSDNVSVSGNVFYGSSEHYVKINSSYNGETIYFGFNFSVVVNGIDEDHDTANRYCQGCLRQFVLNSNAIQGKQRSYFVYHGDLYSDSCGKWGIIKLDRSLGTIEISETLELNATKLNPDMTISDDNPCFVNYDYDTKELKSYSWQFEIAVGVGEDGIPFSGDEEKLKAIPRPEIEIYGGTLNPIFNITTSATGVEFRNFSIFGSNSSAYPGVIRVYGNDFIAENIFAGLRANGTDPKLSGLNRTGGANFWIEANNSTVKNSIVAFAERYGLLFYTSNVKAGRVENVIGYRNALIFDGGDNLGVESSASNVTFSICLSSKASAAGVETNTALGGIVVQNCTIENNGIGNETGVISEIAGIRINANNSVVKNSLIRENGIGVLVSNRLSATTTKQVFNVTITKNSIYNNSRLGIDLADGGDFAIAFRGDNVTLNDHLWNCSQPNCGIDYPVITYAEFDEIENELYVEGFIGKEDVGGSSAFANARVEIYLVKNSTQGDNLIGNNWNYTSQLAKYYGEGYIYLGELYANATGYFNGTITVAGKGVETNSLISATATLNGNTSEFGPNVLVKKRINVSAEISIKEMNATIKVKAFEKVKNVKVYWQKPSGLEIASMSGDYSDNGQQNSIYWWKFNVINANEDKFVYLNLSGNHFSMSEAFNIGVDPFC